MFEGVVDSFRETVDALATDNRFIFLFVAPLILTAFITASFYGIYINSTTSHTFLTLLSKTGSCNTAQPYLITALFENNGVLGYCQVLSFNISIFLAWYAQILLILLIVIYIIVNVFHMG